MADSNQEVKPAQEAAASETPEKTEETAPTVTEEPAPATDSEPAAPAATASESTPDSDTKETEDKPTEEKPAEEKPAEEKPAEAEQKEDGETAEEATPEPEPEPIEIPSGNGELVLVTGATGYVASHIVKALADSGEFRVKGTVRSIEGNERLEKLKSLLDASKYTPEFVEADLTNPDVWADVVKGCDYVIHTASPFPSTEPSDPSEVINPAKEGTEAVIKACLESGTVKRVVLTSSCVAIFSGRPVSKSSLTENDWADYDKAASAYDKSKMAAEKAAWDLMKEAENTTMELSVVNPGLVVGPPLMKMDNTSVEVVKKLMNREFPLLPKLSFPVTDVRDVALAHIRAMMIKQAAGERHIVVTESYWMKDLANMLSQEFNSKGFNIPTTQAPYVLVWLRSHFDPAIKRVLPDVGKMYHFENKRMRNILQIEPREIKTALVEMGHALINLEIVQKIEKPEKKPRKLTFRRKKEKVDDGEEKKDEPEKIKDGSANGSADNVPVEIGAGDANVEEIKVEVNDTEKTDESAKPAEEQTPEVAETPAAAESEKPAEEPAAVSSEEENKEESADPESSKSKDKKDKKEKPKKEKKKGSIFSFSLKRNKKPQVTKREKTEDDKPAEETAASADTPAAEEKTEAEAAPEENTQTEEAPAKTEETPATTEESTEKTDETPAASTEETPKTEETSGEVKETTEAAEKAPESAAAPSEDADKPAE